MSTTSTASGQPESPELVNVGGSIEARVGGDAVVDGWSRPVFSF